MSDASRAPRRVQMSRQKPWRKDHPDAVIVDRRTKWGNPYTVDSYKVDYPDADQLGRQRMAVSDFRGLIDGRWDGLEDTPDHPTLDEIRAELAGKDLACWCSLGDPCHADVLLELANR